MTTETTQTALTVTQRASLALGVANHEKALVALAGKHQTIVAITNVDGYKQCHAARMECKGARIQIERLAKDAREDATAFSKAVIAEEKRLVGIIQPEEDRLNALQAEWDAKVERERQAKQEAERLRVDALRERMDEIRARPHESLGKSAIELEAAIVDLVALEIGPEFAEFEIQAGVAKTEALTKLRSMQANALAREEQAERERAAQEAEARKLADERERLTSARAELEAEQAKARAAQVSAAAKEAAERDAREVDQRRADAERAAKQEADRLAEETARKERMAKELADKQQRERVEAEQAEIARKALAEEHARIAEQRAALIRQQAEANRVALAREIESATLIEAASEAYALLRTTHAEHIATLKLGAALDRERSCASDVPPEVAARRAPRIKAAA